MSKETERWGSRGYQAGKRDPQWNWAPKDEVRVCKACGKTFKPNSRNQAYCNKGCRKRR